MKYGAFQWLIRLRLTILARLLIYPISFYYVLRPSVRKRIAPYLKRRFPNESGLINFFRTAAIYHNFATTIFARLLVNSGAKLNFVQNDKSVALFKKLLEKGHGCMVVGAHFGSYQVGLKCLEDLGYPVSVVLWRGDAIENNLFQYGKGVGVIPATAGFETVMRIRDALKGNGIVCIMGDRMTSGDSDYASVDFLGAPVTFPVAPYLLARKLGAPVVHAASVHEHGAIRGLEAIENDAPWAEAPRVFAAYLENLISKRPFHFFNFYDIWTSDDQG